MFPNFQWHGLVFNDQSKPNFTIAGRQMTILLENFQVSVKASDLNTSFQKRLVFKTDFERLPDELIVFRSTVRYFAEFPQGIEVVCKFVVGDQVFDLPTQQVIDLPTQSEFKGQTFTFETASLGQNTCKYTVLLEITKNGAYQGDVTDVTFQMDSIDIVAFG